MTPVEEIRRAAALMRERAWRATPSPWTKRRGPREHVYAELGSTWVADVATREDMRHIASWHPAIALAVAEVLEAAIPSAQLPTWQDHPTAVAAVALARAYLGEVS